MAKRSVKRQVVAVPGNKDEAARFLRDIGKEQRVIDRVQSDLNQKIDTLKEAAMAAVKIHTDRITALVDGLFAFAEANRDELTDGDKRKTVELPTGSFAWRFTPPAVSLRNVKSVIASIKSLNLADRFLRTKEEVNKEAMLREPEVAEKIKGVTISQREEFVVKPEESAVEIVAGIEKLRKSA